MNLISVGRIAGAHHLKGAVKVNLNLDDPYILDGERIILEDKNGMQRVLKINKISQLKGNRFVVEFDEIDDKTKAGRIAGNEIKIRRELLNLEEGEYLLSDLMGLRAININNDENIGEIVEVIESPAHDILVIADDEYEAMIPNIDVFVKEIDFDGKKIKIDLIEGLRELKNKEEIQDDGLEEE